ncbi:MAG: aldo/keto reductase [Sphingobium sp.]
MSGPIIGMGCASMGSRKSKAESVAALERAYAAGIRWFDVAPSYGDGAAEEVLGDFFHSRGATDVTVATKVGILPGRVSLAKSIIKPAVRIALSLAPGLRSAIKKSRPAAMKQPITPDLIRGSIDESLRRLRTGQLDALLLHGATVEEATDDAILRALEDAVTAGKAKRVGIASEPDAVAAGLAAAPLYTIVQFANNPLEPGITLLRDSLAARPDVTVSTHSVIGATGMIEAMAAQVAAKPGLAAELAAAGYDGAPNKVVSAFLTDYALSSSDVDVVLMSMFSKHHLTANIERLGLQKDSQMIMRIAGQFNTR